MAHCSTPGLFSEIMLAWSRCMPDYLNTLIVVPDPATGDQTQPHSGKQWCDGVSFALGH